MQFNSVYLEALRRCETLWSAREIASVAFSAERERHAENVFHIALKRPNESLLDRQKVLHNWVTL